MKINFDIKTVVKVVGLTAAGVIIDIVKDKLLERSKEDQMRTLVKEEISNYVIEDDEELEIEA